MTTQRLKHFKLGLGILFLSFSGYYLPTYLQLQPVLAQASASQNTEADRLFQEAEQLVTNETKFVQAFSRYQQALRLYRQSGDTTKANATRQRFETVLAAASPLAAKYEQEMDKDEAAFLRQFPKTEDNQTIKQLGELAASQLGIAIAGRPEDTWTVSESQNKAFKDIDDELFNYLTVQGQNATISFAKVPPRLRDYLEKNADQITAIRNLLLNSETPRWGTDMSWISEGNPASYRLPSYLGTIYLQRILAIDILYKQEQGKTKEAQETLEASWKLGQSFKNNPFIIGQLGNIISTRVQLGIMRKLDGLPSVWQQRLLEHDHRQSMLRTLAGESIYGRTSYRWMMNNPDIALENAKENTGEEFANNYLALGWSEWSTTMRQTFLRWESIAIYQSKTDVFKSLANENACTWNFNNWRSTREPIYGGALQESYLLSNFWLRTGRLMVESELTQRILKIKEMGVTAQNLQNVPSVICPNAQWTYEFNSSPFLTQSSITLSPLPQWAAGVQRLPLTYSW